MKMTKIPGSKYLRYLALPSLFGTARTKEILSVNPTVMPPREEAADVFLFVFDYDAHNLEEKELNNITEAFNYRKNNRITWINIDGLRKSDVENMANHFGIHPL